METEEYGFPYNLPIWRDHFKLTSPDGKLVAEISRATESSMGNPTIGTLTLSNGFELSRCNPSFIWSDDSCYLVVPHYFKRFGLFLRQKIIVIDTHSNQLFASKKTTCYFQPESFQHGKLVVIAEPHEDANKIEWSIPEDFDQFEQLQET